MVSSPSVVVVDNQPAMLKVGDEIPVTTQQATLRRSQATIVSSIQFRDTGVILKVIPRVNSTGLVTMDIQQEISAVVSQTGWADADANHLPAPGRQHHLGLQRANGGARRPHQRAEEPRQERRPRPDPLSSAICSETPRPKRTELIVFIRPQVIRDSRDARDVAEELRSRLKSLAPRPPPADGWRTHSAGGRR